MLFKFLIDSRFCRYEFSGASRFLCFLCLAWFPQTSAAQEDWFGDSTQLFIWQRPGPDSTLHSLVFFKPQPVIAAKSLETEISLAVFRNPANGLVRVAGLPANLEATYSVVDIRGRLVEKGNVSRQGELGLQRLANGLFHILINTRNQLYNLKLAVL